MKRTLYIAIPVSLFISGLIMLTIGIALPLREARTSPPCTSFAGKVCEACGMTHGTCLVSSVVSVGDGSKPMISPSSCEMLEESFDEGVARYGTEITCIALERSIDEALSDSK